MTTWMVSLIVAFLLLAGGIALSLLWFRARAALERAQLDELRRREVELRKLTAAVEQSANSIIITDTEGHIEYVNPAFTRITGYALEEVRGKNPRIFKSGETTTGEYSQNLERMVEERTAQLDRARAGLFLSARLSALGRMAAGIAHQLNSPLGGGMLYVDALLDEGQDPERGRDLLLKIRGSLRNMRDVIDAMLAIARVKPRGRRARVLADINEIIDRVLEMSMLECSDRGVRVEKRLDPGLPTIPANVGDLDQVVINIVHNAIDAMEGGGQLTVSSARDGEGIAVRIRDTGGGIPREHLGRIFEPFFTTRAASQGTGLGLSIVNEFVLLYGGKVSVESEVGRGTEFTIWLPLAGLKEGG